MTWMIIPIAGFILILFVVVKDYTDRQAAKTELEYRKRHENKIIPEEYGDEEYDIECETRDITIFKRNSK